MKGTLRRTRYFQKKIKMRRKKKSQKSSNICVPLVITWSCEVSFHKEFLFAVMRFILVGCVCRSRQEGGTVCRSKMRRQNVKIFVD